MASMHDAITALFVFLSYIDNKGVPIEQDAFITSIIFKCYISLLGIKQWTSNVHLYLEE